MSTAARVAITVAAGTWKGNAIRKARKAGRCEYWKGYLAIAAENGGRCRNTINVGDYYLVGELNDRAGGYGQDRYCLDCAGPEARAAVAKAEAL